MWNSWVVKPLQLNTRSDLTQFDIDDAVWTVKISWYSGRHGRESFFAMSKILSSTVRIHSMFETLIMDLTVLGSVVNKPFFYPVFSLASRFFVFTILSLHSHLAQWMHWSAVALFCSFSPLLRTPFHPFFAAYDETWLPSNMLSQAFKKSSSPLCTVEVIKTTLDGVKMWKVKVTDGCVWKWLKKK